MGPRCIGSFLGMITAAALLAVSPCQAWAQRDANPDIWCRKDEVCGRRDTLYSVTMKGGRITIDYLDTDFSFKGVGFSFFEGKIDGPARAKWAITGEIAGVGTVKGVATVKSGDAFADVTKVVP